MPVLREIIKKPNGNVYIKSALILKGFQKFKFFFFFYISLQCCTVYKLE